MEEQQLIEKLNELLASHIDSNTPFHSIQEVYRYAVLPPGKLFRPQLVFAVASDFGNIRLDSWNTSFAHALLASAIEIHHAYTLVHDDMPCMDNDDFRRGKPSTHKAYGEWRALLVGDGLLSLSYRLLSKIKSAQGMKAINFFSWATGTKGLIHGQVLDLAEEMKSDFKTLLETHKLKTARLIQSSLCCSYLLQDNMELKKFYSLFKLGNALGIAFQLLDDLTELGEKELSAHEASIAPWLNFPAEAQKELELRLKQVDQFLLQNNCPELKRVTSSYFKKINKMLVEGREHILNHLEKTKGKAQLAPIMALLDRIS